MVTHFSDNRKKRQARIRAKIFGTKRRPRLSVFRSHRWLFIQLIDDGVGKTIFGASDKPLVAEKNKLVRAKKLGNQLAQTAKTQKITTVVFDRGGYAYHGRVKALAEGLREGGIKF